MMNAVDYCYNIVYTKGNFLNFRMATVTFRTDEEKKKQAMKVADEMGVALSIILNNFLDRLIVKKSYTFSAPEALNAQSQKAFEEAEKAMERGDDGAFTTVRTEQDLDTYFRSLDGA